MNLFTSVLHLLGSGASAYFTAHQMRYSLTRPNILAAYQLAESGSVAFLEALSTRAAQEGDFWLADKLATHAADENRHGQIFAHGLKKLGKEIINFKSLPKKEATQTKEKKRSSFFETYYEGYSTTELKAENIDWQVFMGSTYILELDASKDFVRMANVLKDDDATERNLKTGILSIAEDETRHAAYLLEAMQRRFSATLAQDTVNQWRARKDKALLAMIGNLIEKGGTPPSLAKDSTSVEKPTETEKQPASLATA